MKKNLIKYKIVAVLFGLFGTFQVQAQQPEQLTLEKAVESALEKNNLLHIKKLQVNEQEAKIKEANVKKYPVVSLNSTYQYNTNTGNLSIPAGAFGQVANGGSTIFLPGDNLNFELGKHNNFNAGVSAYQPITQLGKIKTGIDIAKTDRSISEIEQSKSGLRITNNVEQLYYGILAVRKRKEEYHKNIEVAQLQLYDVESALLSGNTILASKAGSKANISDEEQELIKLKFQEEDYIADFKILTGIEADSLEFTDEKASENFDKNLEDFQKDAVKNNVDNRLTALQTQKSELSIKAVKQSDIPEIGIIGAYNYQEGNAIFPKNNAYVGASLRWNIQDLFSNKYLISQRKLIKEQAVENEIYTKKETAVSVEKSYRKMKQAEELIGVAEKAVYYRQQQLKVEKDRNTAGLNKPVDLLQVEADLAKSQADLYGAIQSHRSSLSDLIALSQSGR
ncbi:MAG: TolC family protein [Flavobacterium sp.]